MARPAPALNGVTISPAILGCGAFGGIGGVRELIGQGLDRDAVFAAMDETAFAPA
jgi:hypothetical protein